MVQIDLTAPKYVSHVEHPSKFGVGLKSRTQGLQVKKKRKSWDNFINVFTRSFYTRRYQKRKKLLELTDFFALLGSMSVKAARKHVDASDPLRRGINFTNPLAQV